jgi:hypothetical protein
MTTPEKCDLEPEKESEREVKGEPRDRFEDGDSTLTKDQRERSYYYDDSTGYERYVEDDD